MADVRQRAVRNAVKVGERFERLLVIGIEPGKGQKRAICRCDCGGEKVILGRSLRAGYTRSCGCLQREFERWGRVSHGASRTSLYRIWTGIKTRTTNQKERAWKWYGGRGITMHPAWADDFVAFRDYVLSELGPRPSPDHSIDRIDNDKGYEPDNIRWADWFQQANNRRPPARAKPCNR